MYTHSNYWGDADVDHSQTIGGDTAKLLEGYILPIPPCFGTPAQGLREEGFRAYIVPGPGPRGDRAQRARKSSGFCVKF